MSGIEWTEVIAIGTETGAGAGAGTGTGIGASTGRKGEAVDAGGFLLAGPYL